MFRTGLCAVALLFTLTIAGLARAEEPGTFVRVTARTDLSGRTEVAVHKTYSGQLGPIRDMISLQGLDPDGYPKAEIVTSGAVRASRQDGAIVVESTGPGRGTVDVFITYNDLQVTLFVQNAVAPGVGPIRLNGGGHFDEGMHALRTGNHFTVRTGDGQERTIKDRGDARLWSANAELPAGSMILLNVAGERDPVAPLWMTQVSLAVALLSLALSGYLFARLRRRGKSAEV